MNIEQTPAFRRGYKKLHKNELDAVNEAIRSIISNLEAGDMKKGNLAGVLVYKFRCIDEQFLLAYEHNDNSILLLAIGVHENFYRDLKN